MLDITIFISELPNLEVIGVLLGFWLAVHIRAGTVYLATEQINKFGSKIFLPVKVQSPRHIAIRIILVSFQSLWNHCRNQLF